MSQLLLAFALVQGIAVAAFFWAPLSPEGRAPGDLLPWVTGAAACFLLVVWPLLEGRRAEATGSLREETLGVAGRGGLLLLAIAPFLSASLALAPLPAGAAFRLLLPLVAAWAAGGMLAWAARTGGEEVARAAATLALAGLALGPVARMLSGAAGSLPGPSITLGTHPWLFAFAPLFAGAALLARRLQAGKAEAA